MRPDCIGNTPPQRGTTDRYHRWRGPPRWSPWPPASVTRARRRAQGASRAAKPARAARLGRTL